MPIFVGLQSVPKIAIAPLILVWVGAGIGSKIARRRLDRVLSDRHQHDGGLQGGRSRARRRVPLGRCERAADVLPPAAALRDAVHLRRPAHRHHALGARRDRRRMARRLERARLSGSLRQLQLQYRALVRGDHRAGGDRHDILRPSCRGSSEGSPGSAREATRRRKCDGRIAGGLAKPMEVSMRNARDCTCRRGAARSPAPRTRKTRSSCGSTSRRGRCTRSITAASRRASTRPKASISKSGRPPPGSRTRCSSAPAASSSASPTPTASSGRARAACRWSP